MSIAVAKTNLTDAYRKLRIAWDRAKEQWNDQAARDFEAEIIDPIEARIRTAIKGVDHVWELTHRVKAECGND